MKTIYFDMDGVIADFEEGYTKMFPSDPKINIVHKNWWRLVRNKMFQNLKALDEGFELLKFCLALPNVNVEILSTCGKSQFDAICIQKTKWLDEMLPLNDIHDVIKANFTVVNADKADFATKDTLLLDDRLVRCVEPFRAGGGKGIHYVPENLASIKLEILEWVGE